MIFITLIGALVTVLASVTLAAAQATPSNDDVCRADVDGSGVVDLPDVNAVNAAYRSRVGQLAFNPRFDFNTNGVIDLPDRTFVTTKMGLRCVSAPVNRPPSFTSQPVVAATLGVAYAYQLTATDPDGDPVTLTLGQGPSGLTLAGGLVTWTPGPVGAHAVRIDASDGKGGTATQQFQITVTAPAPPQVSLLAPATGLLTRTPVQTAAGTVSDLGLAAGVLRLNGVEQPLALVKGQFSQPLTLAEGLNRISASVSNPGGTGTSAEVVVTLDTTGPTLEARMPLEVGAGDRVELLAEAFDRSGVASVVMQVDGGPPSSLSRAPYLFAVPVPVAAARGAQLAVTFTATDTLGNTRTIDRRLVVDSEPDTTAPSVQIAMPATAIAGELIPVTISAEDDRGVASMTLLRGTAAMRHIGEAPFAVQHTFSVPADAVLGQVIELGGRAADAAGNVGTTAASLTVVVATVESSELHLSVNPVISPTFLPSQVITGTVSTADVQGQHRPRAFVGSLSVTQGLQGERLNVRVVGANSSFAADSQVAFGAGITVNGVTVQSPTDLIVDITIAPDASIGPRLVAVQSGTEEALLLNAFTVRSGVGAVSGRLVDTRGQALAGVEVCVPGSAICVVTDAAGGFSIAGAPSTASRVSVTVPGINQVSVPIQLAVGGSATLGDISVDVSDVPPDPPLPGAPQPPPSIARVLGLGLADSTSAPSLAKGRRLVTEAFLAVGGTEAGVLDDTGRQLNPEVSGTGLITLKPDGVRALAHKMERGETVALGDLLFAFSFGLVWTADPPRLSDWLDVMQARVNAAWASPLDPQSALPLVVFNRDRTLTATPPQLSPDLRLGPVQAALLTAGFIGALLPESGGPQALVSPQSGRPLLFASARGLDADASQLVRRWWDRGDARPVSDSALGLLRLAVAAQQAGNARRLTGFWRNAFAAKNTFVTQTLNNAFQAEIKLMMALALPAMAPAGLLSTAINVGVASSYIGPIGNFVQGAYGAVGAAGYVPEAPIVLGADVPPAPADGVPQVHVRFKLSSSHISPAQSNDEDSRTVWAYSLYRFRTSDSARELMAHTVVAPESKVPVRTLGGLIDREVTAITPEDLRNVELTLTDREPLPMVDDGAGRQVRASISTWFYAVTATRIRGPGDVRADQLRTAVPWWNYPLGGRLDPGGLMALHTKARHTFVSDYSAPRVLTVNATGIDVRSDGLEIDPSTGTAYYSDTTKRQIFSVDLGPAGTRQLFTTPNFKNAQNGLAIDSAGSLYTNNEASNAEFGGRMFRFTQPSGLRDHVGTINYYSFLLQSAHPASASAMSMGPGSQPGVSVEDLFLVDDLAQVVKRVPVRAAFDPTRRIGQPWASLPFPARAVDFEFVTPPEGSDDRPDGVLLVDGLPATTLTAALDVTGFAGLGDSLTARVRIGNPGSQDVSNVRPVIAFSGDGELRQVSAPPTPIVLAAGASQEYTVQLNAAGSGTVTMRLLGQGTDVSSLSVSSPPVERRVVIDPPLAISISAPTQASPGNPFEVLVQARNRSASSRLVDVTPTIAPFDPTVGSLDPLGELSLVSGPQPATLALDPGATSTFRYQFSGTRMGRAGLEARATARTADTQVAMSAGPAKANVNINPLTVDLIVPPAIKKGDTIQDARVVFRNQSAAAVTVIPELTFAGVKAVIIPPPSVSPFGAGAITVPAQGETTVTFPLKGDRRGLAQLEAYGRIDVSGTSFPTNRDIERVSVGPTLTGTVSDVGFRSLNLAYDANLMLNGLLRVGPLDGLVVVADDGNGTRAEATTGGDGRYVMNLDHGGPYTVTVVHPGRNVGATLRDVLVLPGEDVLTKDIDLPVTLVTQARSVAAQIERLPLNVDHEKVTIGAPGEQGNVTLSYGTSAAAYLAYLERFQQGANTPFFEYPMRPAEERELSAWHSLIRQTLLLTFTKRRFDEAAVIAGPFVKLVVDYVVSKIGIDKAGARFDQTLQNGVNDTFFRVPENSSLAKELADVKIDFDKLGKTADDIQGVLLKINGVICPYFEGLIDFAEAQGDAVEDADRARMLEGCKQATDTAAAVIQKVLGTLKLTLGSAAADSVTNAVKQVGMSVGVEALMTRYVSVFTEPTLVSALHRAEHMLEFRGDTVEVLRSLRDYDNATRAEVLARQASIEGNGGVDASVQGFLKSAASTIDQNLLSHLKEGAGLLGRILGVLTNLDQMALVGEATAIGPGRVCRSSNQMFRADAAAAFAQEPPATTLFCVQDLPNDR